MTKEEAIEIIRDARCTSPLRDALETLIPELCESEDERIRKGLIHHLKELREWKAGTMSPIKVSSHYDAWIAYLEKQKEQPTNEEMLRTLRAEYEKGVADTIAKYEQKEQKPADRFEEAREKYQAEWSDNDDQLIGFIFDLLNDLVWRKDWAMSKEECLERLKSLRPSWKPSAEQMDALERTTNLSNFGLESNRRQILLSLYEQLKKLI